MTQSNYPSTALDLEDWIESSFTPIIGTHRVGELRIRTTDPGAGDLREAVDKGLIKGGLARVIKRGHDPDIRPSFRAEEIGDEGSVSASANDVHQQPGDGYEGGSSRVSISGNLASVSSTPADVDDALSIAPEDMTISGNVGVTWDSASGSGTLYVTINSESTSVSVTGTGAGSGVAVLSNPVVLSSGDSVTIQAYTSGNTVNGFGVAMFGFLS